MANVTPRQLERVKQAIQTQEENAQRYFDRASELDVPTNRPMIDGYVRRGNACLDVARGMRMSLVMLGLVAI